MNDVRRLPGYVRNSLRGAANPYAKLSEFRRQLSPDDYSALAAWIPNLVARNRGFVDGRFPTTFRALRREFRVFHAITARNEIAWCATVLAQHLQRITTFRNLASSFEKSILDGDYEEASANLDSIEKTVGHSFWLIEARLALSQQWKGLEAQKSLAAQFRSSTKHTIVGFCIYLISERNETTTNPKKFRAAFADSTRSWNVNEDFRNYVLYRIADQMPLTPRAVGAILRNEALSPNR